MKERQHHLSGLTHTMSRKVRQLCRWAEGNEEFNKEGLHVDVFETIRTQERQNQLIKDGVSWVKKSTHQLGLAADIVICRKSKDLKIITEYLWSDSPYYKMLAKKADEIGLCSYNLTYGRDVYHFELPAIWQPESDCYAYSVVNAMRLGSSKWRQAGKNYCADIAEEIQEKSTEHNIRGTLEAAKSLGYIKDFIEVEPEEITNDGQFVCQTKTGYLGPNKVQAQLDRIAAGKGIRGHATAVAEVMGDNIWMLNSHERTYPAQYAISKSNWGEIMKAYRVVL